MSLSWRYLFASAGAAALLILPAPFGAAIEDGRAAATTTEDDSVVLLARAASYVQQYFSRAQTLVSRERVMLQPLRSDMMPDGRARRLEYELRVDWTPPDDVNPAGSANVVRQLLRVDGRPPKPGDEPGCMDPRDVSPEPLAMFLPQNQRDYVFRFVRAGRAGGRAAALVEYTSRQRGEPVATWREECVSIELPGRSAGRVWLHPGTGEILRVDERLVGMVAIPIPRDQRLRGGGPQSMTIERADSTIEYKPVALSDTDETLLMPASIITVTVVRDSGAPRMRMTQTFDAYRRFLTGGRIVQ
jgi:hypothetical protein